MTPARGEHVMRVAGARDVEAIRALTRAAYARWVPVIGREPLPMNVDYDVAVKAHRFDLLEREGELEALVETIAAADHLFIENLAVSPACQGQGLGRRLLGHVDGLAASLGHPAVRLLTNGAFQDNIRFYQRAGYAIDREEPFRDGITVYMSKTL